MSNIKFSPKPISRDKEAFQKKKNRFNLKTQLNYGKRD
jgi:hypothetical protein